MATHGPRAAEIDCDDLVELLGAHVHERAVAHDSGVVHDRVEPAERVDAGLDHRFRDPIVRHGAGRRDDPTAVRLDLAREVVQQRLVRAVHDEVGAFGCERERERPTETSRRSRDDDPLAVEHAHGGRA